MSSPSTSNSTAETSQMNVTEARKRQPEDEGARVDEGAELKQKQAKTDNQAGSASQPSATKRAKSENDDDADIKDTVSAGKSDPPAYASKDYWENRYQINFGRKTDKNADNDDFGEHKEDSCSSSGGDDKDNDKKKQASSSDSLPYHAWYFTYNDLRPLLLPLILGGRQDAQQVGLQNEDDDESSEAEKQAATQQEGGEGSESKKTKAAIQPDSSEVNPSILDDKAESEESANMDSGKDDAEAVQEEVSSKTNEQQEDDDDEFEEVQDGDDESEDDEEEEMDRCGLAKDGPISVMEVGCGDVPLGGGLALELKNLQEATGSPAMNVVKQIVCTDYSETVVDTMRNQYRKTTSTVVEAAAAATTTNIAASSKESAPLDVGNVPLDFEVADARKLPYPDKSFDLILEKGTLDAMLSDKKQGVADCVAIVTECARTLQTGGYIMIISHLNAHTGQGIGWLQEVVFEGLQAGDKTASYKIEVHGSDQSTQDVPGVPLGSPGPCVYIIHKMAGTTTEATSTTATEGDEQAAEKRPTIPVKFYAY